MPRQPFPTGSDFLVQAMRLPDTLDEPGLLVGWSLEHTHSKRAVGFSFGDETKTPSTGYIDPIQLAREGHLITLAPTGAGKGVGCIVPALLRHQGPVIVIDPKGENAAITARHRREMGQQVYVLDPMGITDFESAALNPLDMMDVGSVMGVDAAASISQSLWGLPVSDRDQFWVSRAQHLITGLILHVLADLPDPAKHTLASVREVLNEFSQDPDRVIKRLGTSRHPEVRQSASLLAIPAKETLGGILSFAQEMLDFVRGPQVQAATGRSSFSLEEVTRGEPLSIYLVIPPHMLESHGRLLRLWISTLLSAITRRRAQPRQSTLFLLDEAAQLGTLPQLRQAITLLRGYGLQTWSFWQDVSQLQLLYPSDWRTMVNNCQVLQCFGALNLIAAKAMVDLTGFGHPELILDLEQDEMILQLAGDEAVVARLPNYRLDAPFTGQFDANPYYDRDRDVMPKPYERMRFYERETGALRKPGKIVPSEIMKGFLKDVDKPADERDPLLERLLSQWDG